MNEKLGNLVSRPAIENLLDAMEKVVDEMNLDDKITSSFEWVVESYTLEIRYGPKNYLISFVPNRQAQS
jgi:hypothetical protein